MIEAGGGGLFGPPVISAYSNVKRLIFYRVYYFINRIIFDKKDSVFDTTPGIRVTLINRPVSSCLGFDFKFLSV